MGKKPVWYRGKQVECVICGFWYPEQDSRITKKDGNWYCKKDLDTLTEEERQEQAQRRKG